MFWMTLLAGVLSLVFLPVLALLSGSEIPVLSETIESNFYLIRVIWICLMTLLILWSPLYEYWYLRNYFYDMDEKNLIIRKGVITKTEITLPFTKITDVFVDQDLFDVVLCLYDLHISTPTAESGRFAHIDGVDARGAAKLKAMILDRVNRATTH